MLNLMHSQFIYDIEKVYPLTKIRQKITFFIYQPMLSLLNLHWQIKILMKVTLLILMRPLFLQVIMKEVFIEKSQ